MSIMNFTDKDEIMEQPFKPSSRKQSAQGMVEFALVLPILLMLSLGIMEVGRLMAFYTSALTASREGARVGAAAGQDDSYVYNYQNCTLIREQALRVGLFAGMSEGDIQIHYDHGPDFEGSPFGNCAVGGLGPTDLDLGDRIVVQATAVWEPIVPLVPLQPITLNAISRRTILKDVGVEGPPPELEGPEVSFSTSYLGECIENTACVKTLYVQLSQVWHEDVFVTISTRGRARRGIDYTVGPYPSIRVPALTTSASITITVLDDTLYEGEGEDVTIYMVGATNARIVGNTLASMYIIDDDPKPIVSFIYPPTPSAQSKEEGDSGTTPVAVQARLNTLSGLPVAVQYRAIGGTATYGEDYTINTDWIIIPAGSLYSSPQDVHINLLGDNWYEHHETVLLEMYNPVDADLHHDPTYLHHILTILNDDDKPEVFFLPEAQAGSESVGTLGVEVWLSHPSQVDTPVSYSIGGTATRNADYTIPSSPLTIPAGEVTRPITITLIQDQDDAETEETVILSITNVGPDALIGSPSVHTATITEDVVPPTIWFAPATQTVPESVGRIYLRVRLSVPFAQPINLAYTFSGSSQGDGVDYTNLRPNPMEIPPNVTEYSIILDIHDDNVFEATENIVVTMVQPVNAVLGDPHVHTVMVTDNEPPPTVFFTSAAQTAVEGDGTVAITAQLSSYVTTNVLVPFTLHTDTTATPGVDFTISASPLTIPAGSLSADILVNIIDDTVLNEPKEYIVVTMGTPSNAQKAVPDTHTITLVDNDACPTLTTLAVYTAGTKMSTYINHTSQGAMNVTIDEIAVGWVTGGGQSLRTIYYDTSKIFDRNMNNSPTLIPSQQPWVTGADRTVPANASMKLFEIHFAKQTSSGRYSLYMRFSNGCNITLSKDL